MKNAVALLCVLLAACSSAPANSSVAPVQAPSSSTTARPTVESATRARLSWFREADHVVFCVPKSATGSLPLIDGCAAHFQGDWYCVSTAGVGAPTTVAVVLGRVDAEPFRQCMVSLSQDGLAVTRQGDTITVQAAGSASAPVRFLVPDDGSGIGLLGEDVDRATVGPSRARSVLDNAPMMALLSNVDLSNGWLVASGDSTSGLLGEASESLWSRVQQNADGSVSSVHAVIAFQNATAAESVRSRIAAGGLPQAVQSLLGTGTVSSAVRGSALTLDYRTP
ncbi:MAG: hypothetical protein IPK60_24125 [Sandaracinaceae bacterium]|nr:hypothetical protein [Sandaracinaceae bacterium]